MNPAPPIDHDQNFKELISTFFLEFLELFLPDVARQIEPNSIKFLQQEYFTDAVEGEEKIIDLLAEVKLAGEDVTFLMHLEAQSTSRAHFNRRLFFYFSLLHQKHLKPVYPIVVFSFDKPQRAEPDHYKLELLDRKILEFNFVSIQLNRLNWRDYIDRPNPVAAALMSKMKIAKGDRPKVKAECLRLLVTLRLDPGKMRMIAKFVDTYLRLNQQEEQTFRAELDNMDIVQKEEIMEVTTSWEERGIEKGRQAVALKMLSENLDLEMIARFTGISIDQLQVLKTTSQQPT